MENKKVIKVIKNGLPYLLLFCAVFFGLMFLDSNSKDSVAAISQNQKNEESEQKVVATTTLLESIKQKELPKEAEKKSSQTKALLVPCGTDSTSFVCYQNYYTNLVEQKGVATAFADLKKEYELSGYVRSQCHPLTHVIGHSAVTLYPEVSTAFEHGDPFCWSGYYHGVMEEIVEKTGTDKITSKLDNICSGISGKESYSFDYYNCVHGLGHGLMAITENELFDSLKYCDNLSGSWEEASCYGGVFMENVMIDNRGLFTKYLKPAEPLYPCNAVDERYKSSCYLMQTSYMLKVLGQDFGKVFAQCRLADKNYVGICFQSLGRDASGQSLSNAQATKAKCDLGADYNEKSNCIVGAVKDFVSYYHSDVQAKSLCQSLDADLQEICLNTAISYYQSF